MNSSKKTTFSGFKYAQDGILHSFRTQPNMRFHFYVLVSVLLAGLLLNLDNRDMLALIFAISLVIVAEMFNTTVEAVVDMVTPNYSQSAKLAKDVSAGAVLIAAMNALIAGTIVFFGQPRLIQIQDRMRQNMNPNLDQALAKVVVVGIVLLALIVVISKLLSNTGLSPWHGGIISGHSAVGFLLAMTICFTAHNSAVAFLAVLLAILVAQSRVEAGIHSVREVVAGAVLAILLTALIYRVMPFVRYHLAPVKSSHSAFVIHRNSGIEQKRGDVVFAGSNASSGFPH